MILCPQFLSAARTSMNIANAINSNFPAQQQPYELNCQSSIRMDRNWIKASEFIFFLY